MNAEFFKNWRNQARKGLLELVILNDISRLGMYGYEIERRFCKSEGLMMSRGTIYSILGRFRASGLVTAEKVQSPDGPERKYYELTKAGRETLAQMNAYWKAVRGQMATLSKGR